MKIESENEFKWELGNLPFFWGALDKPTNGGSLPDELPFGLYVNTKSGILMQTPNADVSTALSEAYKRGSEITGMMDESGIGSEYARDFFATIKGALKAESLNGKRILEIGCGTGYLLSLLKDLGADVLGIEPGEQGQRGSKKYGVPVIRDFFPSEKVKGKFDLILIYAVLEHLEQPDKFLKEIKSYLNPNGYLILSVPNCEPYLEQGDISVLYHEHWSYFTSDTLRQLLVSSNFHVHSVMNSGFGGALYAVGSSTTDGRPGVKLNLKSSLEWARKFRSIAEMAADKLMLHITRAQGKGQSVGIYVPSRLMNILLFKGIPLSQVRFFDDNSVLHGKYLPGINIPIESRSDLHRNPVDVIFILSKFFGEEIKKRISSEVPATSVVTWSEIFTTE